MAISLQYKMLLKINKLRNMFCQAYHSRTNIRCKNVNTPAVSAWYRINISSRFIRFCVILGNVPLASALVLLHHPCGFFHWRIKNGAVLIARPCRCCHSCRRFYLLIALCVAVQFPTLSLACKTYSVLLLAFPLSLARFACPLTMVHTPP